MITYEWNCRTLDTYPTASDSQDPVNTQNDVVFNVHWALNGSIEVSGSTYRDRVIGTQQLSTSDLSSFTSFDSITHDDIIGWVTSSMESPEDDDPVTTIKNRISSSLAERINPTVVTKYLD